MNSPFIYFQGKKVVSLIELVVVLSATSLRLRLATCVS